MDYSVEERFASRYIRKNRRERMLFELTTPDKRFEGLDRFCHHASELLNPERIRMEGEDLERSAGFLEFLRGQVGKCHILSPDYSLDGLELPLKEAMEKAVSCFDAVIIVGNGFAVVFGEVMKGGRGKYLLV